MRHQNCFVTNGGIIKHRRVYKSIAVQLALAYVPPRMSMMFIVATKAVRALAFNGVTMQYSSHSWRWNRIYYFATHFTR